MTTIFQSIVRDFTLKLFNSYESFKVESITSCRFTQAEMLNWLEPFKGQNLFHKSTLGASSEGKIISLYTLGRGSVKVMLWSQMHGDEPTATMALVDMISFFAKNHGSQSDKNDSRET